MELETSRYGTYSRMRFNGEMTADSVDKVRSDWEEKLEQCLAVEIDLSGARRIDLSGVRMMLQLRERAKQECKLLLFIGWNPAIEEALHVYHWFVDLITSGRYRTSMVFEGSAA